MAEKLIGKVVHYFDNISVAVIALDATLKVGDKIRIEGGETNFEQEVASMQIDREPMDKAKKGQEVGMKVEQKVRDGYRVFKV
jgi:putative protease